MTITMKSIVFNFVVAAALLQSSQAQTVHVVLDTLGWTIPPAGSIAYTTWAATQSFAVGDVLFFNYTTGAHDVAEVTKTAFDDCNSANTLSTATNGPTNVTLNSTGEHLFICTFGTHCTLGQKLAINVSASTPSSPSTPSTTTTPPPPPPPVSSAPPLAIAAFPITLLSILVCFLQ